MKLAIALASALLAGCATTNQTPLVFGETITLGVAIGAGTTEGGELTLGFKTRDIAIVPVMYTDGTSPKTLMSDIKGADKSESKDALSVLGQFSSNTDAKAAKVGLGKFFATGAAASSLAAGFRKSLETPEK